MNKRGFIRSAGAALLSSIASVQAANSKPITTSTLSMPTQLLALLDVLHALDNPACRQAATQLAALPTHSTQYNLHLRSAKLQLAEIQRLFEAIKNVYDAGGPALHSLSLSYNAQLGDVGVLALVATVPPTLVELGLVGCTLSDTAGNALSEWAAKQPSLRMLCIEQNNFSNTTQKRLKQLSANNSGLFVEV